ATAGTTLRAPPVGCWPSRCYAIGRDVHVEISFRRAANQPMKGCATGPKFPARYWGDMMCKIAQYIGLFLKNPGI
ncbi:MAG: hypothetical protein WCS75_12150, partial [Sphingomonas sp.]